MCKTSTSTPLKISRNFNQDMIFVFVSLICLSTITSASILKEEWKDLHPSNMMKRSSLPESVMKRSPQVPDSPMRGSHMSFVMKRSPVPDALPGAWPERDGVGRAQLSLSITNSMEVLRQKLLRELIRRRQSGQYVSSDQYLDEIG